MKKWWKESALRQQENGMEAIEGLLVITLMLFVLFYILTVRCTAGCSTAPANPWTKPSGCARIGS